MYASMHNEKWADLVRGDGLSFCNLLINGMKRAVLVCDRQLCRNICLIMHKATFTYPKLGPNSDLKIKLSFRMCSDQENLRNLFYKVYIINKIFSYLSLLKTIKILCIKIFVGGRAAQQCKCRISVKSNMTWRNNGYHKKEYNSQDLLQTIQDATKTSYIYQF